MHMGEVAVGSAPFSGTLTDVESERLPVNATLSLHIGASWTDPKTLSFQAFPKTQSAVYNYGTLWYDQTKNEVFTFGGEQSTLDDGNRVDLSIDKLVPTNDGYGTWTTNSTERNPPFSKPGITRSIGGATTQSNTMAFWLGGYSTNATSDKTKSLKQYSPTPGLVSYEFATGAWANVTLDPTLPLGIPNGSIEWAGMEYLPKLGPSGMLVIWGGETSNTSMYEPDGQARPMTNIVLYDPVAKRWFTQQASGTTPSVRNRFCSVSVRDPRPIGSNMAGTHEIYMYGGYAGNPGKGTQQYDEIWALSIPSFTWNLIDSSHNSPRMGHTCHLIGKKQMLSIGGVNIAENDIWNTPDFINWNGIGVYDLSAATWVPGFNAEADIYRRPKVVEDAINSNGPYPLTWTQQSLASTIVNNNPSDTSNAPLTGPPPNSTTDQNPVAKSSHTGLVAGATIGGILAATMPFIVIYLYFYYYRPRRNTKEVAELPATIGNEKHSTDPPRRRSVHNIFSHSRGRSWGRSRGRSLGQNRGFPVELDSGETAGELGLPTPAMIPTHTTIITANANEGRQSSDGDYFSFLRPSGWKTPQLLTPGVKEVPVAITPKGSHEGGRPSEIPKVPHVSERYLQPPSFGKLRLNTSGGRNRPTGITPPAVIHGRTSAPHSTPHENNFPSHGIAITAPHELRGDVTPRARSQSLSPPSAVSDTDIRDSFRGGHEDEISSPSSFLDERSLRNVAVNNLTTARTTTDVSPEIELTPISPSGMRGLGLSGVTSSPDSSFFMDDD